MHPVVLHRLACDAVLQATLLTSAGAVLDLGREARTVTPGQRRALTARDGGCVIPGCTAPARWCEGHHVQWWRHGGRTDLANLALLCGRHHTEVHAGVWALQLRDGIPWARPPDWADPQQRWIRNTYWDDLGRMRRHGTQLRLPLDHPSDLGDPGNPDEPESASGAGDPGG